MLAPIMTTTNRTMTPSDLGFPANVPLPERSDWRIGIIGLGGISGAHIPAYRSAGWNVVAAADIDPERRAHASSAHGIPRVYEDYRDVIADGDVEIVSLLTHPTLREPVVRAAAEAGKPLLTEKPLAPNVEECERIVAIAEDAGIPFAVSQNYRWHPGNFYARHIVERGLIGAPYLVSIEIFGTQDVDVAGNAFYSQCDDFLTVQWNTHMVDLMRSWTGRDARRVLARTGRMNGQTFASDMILVSIADFGEGLTGHVLHAELLRSSMTFSRCRVEGDAGSIVFAPWGAGLEFESKELGEGVVSLQVDESAFLSSFCGPMGELLISIEQGRESATSARRNLATMRHVLAEDQSAREGGVWVACG